MKKEKKMKITSIIYDEKSENEIKGNNFMKSLMKNIS